MKKKSLKILAYLILWIVIAEIVELILNDSPSRVAYGLISAWWSTLYLCRLIDLKIDSLFLLIFSGIPFLFYLRLSNHDDVLIDFIWIFFSIILYVSPFLVHLAIVFIEKRLFNKHRDKKV